MKRDAVKTQKPEHAQQQGPSAEERAAQKLCTCALSGKELLAPLVADFLGNLYNKEALLAAVLDKSLARLQPHIRSRKLDTFDVTATPSADGRGGGGAASAAAAAAAVSAPGSASGPAPFICPVSGLEANGRYAFVAIRGCGCIVAERAVRALKDSSSSNSCPACGAVFGGAAAEPERAGAPEGEGAAAGAAASTSHAPTRPYIVHLAPTEEERKAAFQRLSAAQQQEDALKEKKALAKGEKAAAKRATVETRGEDCKESEANKRRKV